MQICSWNMLQLCITSTVQYQPFDLQPEGIHIIWYKIAGAQQVFTTTTGMYSPRWSRTGRSPIRRPGLRAATSAAWVRSPLPRQGRQPLQRQYPHGRPSLPRNRPETWTSALQTGADDVVADSSSTISQSPSPRHIPCRFRATAAAVETEESSPSSTPTIINICQDEYSPNDDGHAVERDPFQGPQITLRDVKGRAPSEPDTNDEREPADSSFELQLQTRYRAHGSTSAPSTASTGQPGSSQQPTLVEQELEERRQAGITVML